MCAAFYYEVDAQKLALNVKNKRLCVTFPPLWEQTLARVNVVCNLCCTSFWFNFHLSTTFAVLERALC